LRGKERLLTFVLIRGRENGGMGYFYSEHTGFALVFAIEEIRKKERPT
jgi:hypothetical protein